MRLLLLCTFLLTTFGCSNHTGPSISQRSDADQTVYLTVMDDGTYDLTHFPYELATPRREGQLSAAAVQKVLPLLDVELRVATGKCATPDTATCDVEPQGYYLGLGASVSQCYITTEVEAYCPHAE